MDKEKKYFCPRLLDYIVIVGSRNPNSNNHVAQTPELLRRYPLEDHKDFPLPTDVIFFCQPEGCTVVGPKRMSLRESTSFVFTLTEKDSGISRYGICVNFFRPFEKRSHGSSEWQKVERTSFGSATSAETSSSLEMDRPRSPRLKKKSRSTSKVRNNTLTSLCIVSHHPFFSTFRECLAILRRLIEACHDRSCVKRIGGSKGAPRDTVWGVLTGQCSENITSLVMHEVREIETWILRLLSAPVPVPGKTRVEVSVLPHDMQAPLMFALPDSTRFQLVDFPLHLPLELLGVDTCLKVLTAIMLEHKVILQSRDYNALSMSVMAFVAMLYPLEYMFPVIPLLPTCMAAAEQLLLAPTPFLIGVPASFFLYKKDFKMPDDIWLVDLDSNKINPPPGAAQGVEALPPLPEPEGQCLKTHLKQALASMSMTPQPIKNLDAIAQNPEMWQRRESFSSQTGFNPLIYGNDVDSVDVATRVAMIRFFNSPNILGNFTEHTRTLRLYPRPVVAFQLYSFLKSRPTKTHFTARLARTQAVEYYAEWSLCPTNMVYLRVQTAVYDPSLIGDKPKWYAHQLQRVEFHVYDESSSLGAAITSVSEVHSDEVPTDESGSDSEGAESTSSSYSSLSDFVTDMVNSEIDGETPAFLRENQILAVDESKVFCPPSKLHVPDENTATQNESTILIPESSDLSSSESSSPTYSHDSPRPDRGVDARDQEEDEPIFRYDSGHVTATSQSSSSRAGSLSQGSTPVQPDPSRKPSGPMGPSPYGNPPSFGNPPPFGNPSSFGNVPSFGSAPPYGNPPQAFGTTSAFEPPEKPRTTLLPPPPARNLSIGSRGSGSSGGSSSSTKKAFRALSDQGSDRSSTPSSIISTISNELTDMAHSATSNLSELFGTKQAPASTPPVSKPAKPFTPLGTRKALVEKSGLVKHATNRKPKEPPKPPASDVRGSTNSENQQFLKEVVTGILEGQGLSWLKMNRVKKLMEDENYRNFVVSRLNRNLDKKLGDAEAQFIEDVCLSKQVFRGMVTMMKAMIYGLEFTYRNHGLGGMASAFVLLEIIHTHFWAREANRSETSLTPEMASLHGSHESLGSKEGDITPGGDPLGAREDPVGSPVIVNGDEFENIEMPPSESHQDFDSPVEPHRGHNPHPDMNRNVEKQGGAPHCDIVVTEAGDRDRDGDLLRQLLTHKDAMRSAGRQLDKRFSSIDSEVSEASTLVSSSSDNNEEKRRARINHHSIRTALSDSEADNPAALKFGKRSRSPSVWSSKSNLSTGFRYHEGKMISVSKQTNADIHKTYLFEGLIGKDRSPLWDQMQFWEDVYLDAVAQERDIIGMDQRPSEMIERYMSLGDVERKRLEHDEDKLLSLMLYDLVSFMVMMGVNKTEIKKKIRRLLGKSHIGLAYSQEVNILLDHITNLHGNDIDLKPMGSRLMQKQSFTVHWGTDNSGDMLFMEVCDDCLLLRSVTGTIHDRWWFEKLVNMTYCPKTKVLCLWRKNGEKVQLNQFYTKKCRELYFCVKESMEKAVSRNSGKLPGPELGGEFPVQDLKSGQGGLLQVCMEGIGLLLANSKFFIELSRVRKCFTQKGGIFVLEEFDPKTKQVIQHKFKSSMAIQVAFMVHRIFAVQWSRYLAAKSLKARLDQNHNS